jgi:ribosomal protein S18 acetylase RimI-like enzyme
MPNKVENVFVLFQQMGRYYPEEPHWYLPLIGVDPVHKGHGCGSALIKHALAAL